jgi:hypothetical protein
MDYSPLRLRADDGSVTPANPTDPLQWMPRGHDATFLFGDLDPPWDDEETRERCEGLLLEWGVN